MRRFAGLLLLAALLWSSAASAQIKNGAGCVPGVACSAGNLTVGTSGGTTASGDIQITGNGRLWSSNSANEYLLLINTGTNTTDLSAGSAGFRIFNSGNAIAVVGVDNTGHVNLTNGAVPTIASGACGTGTNGTITGSDQAGKITIGAVATTACAVSFGSTFAAAPKACLFSAATSGSAAVTVLPFISAISGTGFTLSGSVLANTAWYFHCI